MGKFAFRGKHTVVVRHETLGELARASHEDPDTAEEMAHKQVVDKYKDDDERRGVIGTREARGLVRFDSKVGALTWHRLKPDE